MSNLSFGIGLYLKLLAQQPDKNIFVSPLSISMALGMTLNGADTDTAQSIKETLGLSDMEMDEINSINETLISTFCADDREQEPETPENDPFASEEKRESKLVINVANSLWAREGLTLKGGFAEICEKKYKAQTGYLDPGDPNAPDKVNSWAAEKTNGKIQIVIDEMIPNFVLILVNAVYFKAPWALEFTEDLTHQRPFHLADGATKDHPLMFNTETYPYQKGEFFQAIRLPYEDRRYAMTIVLPDEESSLNQLHKSFSAGMWDKIRTSLKVSYGQVGLPRFEADWGRQVNDALSSMGMGVAFSEDADFSRMISGGYPVRLDEVFHKTYIKVWEKGTEAAAVTTVTAVDFDDYKPEEEFQMIIDRPFLYIIDDNMTGAILFIGSMQNPEDISGGQT